MGGRRSARLRIFKDSESVSSSKESSLKKLSILRGFILNRLPIGPPFKPYRKQTESSLVFTHRDRKIFIEPFELVYLNGLVRKFSPHFISRWF